MIRAIALDDEPLALKIIEAFCERISMVKLEKTFTRQSDAMRYLRSFPVDLIFLDVEMPSQNGFDFYKSIPQDTKVIFTTAYSDYAVDAFEMNAVDYLLKPFPFERFRSAVEKMRPPARRDESGFMSIRAGYQLHRVNLEHIVLIEGFDDYVRIHLKDSEQVTARSSMKSVLARLPADQFLRVHRSYIVPVRSIRKLIHKNLHISGFVIPIGETYKEAVSNFLK